MIVVSGTKRSGTSLWMQILEQAGFHLIGSKFPVEWEKTIRNANPNGFYESKFRDGINYATNSPEAYVDHESTKNSACKIFLSGLVRSDMAYLHKVIVTVRHWSEYETSLRKLYIDEMNSLSDRIDDPQSANVLALNQVLIASRLDVSWFFENYNFLKDYAARKFPARIYSYDRLLSEPDRVISEVFAWLEFGKTEHGLRAIDTQLAKNRKKAAFEPNEHAEIYNEFYHALSKGTVSSSLMAKLDAVASELKPVWDQQRIDRQAVILANGPVNLSMR